MRTRYRLPAGLTEKVNAVAVEHAATINTPPHWDQPILESNVR
jgi:hypothetical protein